MVELKEYGELNEWESECRKSSKSEKSELQWSSLHEASSFTELHHWFTYVFHASKVTVI